MEDLNDFDFLQDYFDRKDGEWDNADDKHDSDREDEKLNEE